VTVGGIVAPIVVMLALLVGEGCTPSLRGVPQVKDPQLREVTVRVIRPPRVNLYDRGIETLGVVDFDGPAGTDIARRLAAQVEDNGAFRVLDPISVSERLMKAGLSVGWEAEGSLLRWVHERTALDAVVVGRVEVFRVEEGEKTKQTLALRGTGEYSFVMTEEGKLAYRERMAYHRLPLFCRLDRGTVAASYRVWDVRRGEQVATSRHELTTEMSSFCYRGDVPERLKIQALDRLLQKLFLRLNEQFLDEIVPRTERTQLAFEVLPGGSDPTLLQRNELGILYASRAEWRRAVEMWQDCLLHRPDFPAAHYNLAMAYRATGRLSLALEHLKKAVAVVPRPVYRSSLAEIRGMIAGS
jgi:hypothetical protein